jgi:TolA-binding protein
LTEIENFFPNSAAEAALKIAFVCQNFGDEKGCVAALRAVMKKYPKTGQSNTAHIELERRGKGMGGGIDAD